MSEGYSEEKIGILLKEISKKIAEGSPKEQTISLLGSNVPGVLAIYATPLILVTILYYLYHHSVHLVTLADKHKESFIEFSWLPFQMKRGWWVELASSAMVLPVVAIGTLNYKLSLFGEDLVTEHMVSAGAALLILFFGLLVLKNIGAMRRHIY